MKKNNAGATLIELLVGIGLMFLVATVISQVFLSTRQQVQTQEALARIQENGRQALYHLNTDVRMAGFIGPVQQYWKVAETTNTPRRIGTITDECFTATGGNSFRWIAPMAAVSPLRLPPRVFGKDNTRVDFEGCIDSSNYVTNTDVLSVHYAALPRIANSALVEDVVYLRSNIFGAALFECNTSGGAGVACLNGALNTGTFPIGDDLWGNVGTPDPTPETANYPIFAAVYYVRPCTDTGANDVCDAGVDDDVPTLVRARIEYNTANCNPTSRPCVVHEPIATGVVSFQVEYGLDSAVESGVTPIGTVNGAYRAGLPDGYVDRYVPASAIDGGSLFSDDALEMWTNVLTVRIWLLIRTDMKEAGYTPKLTQFDLAGESINAEGTYRHQLFTSTIAIRNLAG